MIVVNELGRVVKSTVLVQEDILQLDAPMRVNPTGVADTNVLAYNAASSTWLPSAAGSGTVGGSGTAPKIPKWTAGSTLGDSILSESVAGVTVTETQGIATSGSPNALVVVGGAHTTLTASVEAIDVNVNLARTVQFSAGALATQRAVVFQAPTYAFVSGSTLTTAATVAITGAPATGASATITNPLAFWVQTGNVLLGTTIFPLNAALYVQQASATSGTPTAFIVSGGGHTGLAAGTEAFDINFNLNRSVQFATGALTSQRAVVFQAPTYAFVGASTITTAATVAITGAPAAGTFATLTASLAFWVQAGRIMTGSAEEATNYIDELHLHGTVTATASRAVAVGFTVASVLTANANSDGLYGLSFVPTFAKGAFTGLATGGILVAPRAPTGAGTIATYFGVWVVEQTIATANVGLLVGSHPGGSTNYSMYLNSSNALFLGSGAMRLDSQHSTGANTATFAATNKPGSAITLAPQTWLKINLGGTDYYIPCWI